MRASQCADLGAMNRRASVKPRNYKGERVSKNLEKVILFLQRKNVDQKLNGHQQISNSAQEDVLIITARCETPGQTQTRRSRVGSRGWVLKLLRLAFMALVRRGSSFAGRKTSPFLARLPRTGGGCRVRQIALGELGNNFKMQSLAGIKC